MDVDLRHFFHPKCLGLPSLCDLLLQQFSFLYIQTLRNDCSHIEDMHLLFSNVLLQQFSFLYIQCLHNGCSHIEDMHLLYCFLNLDIVFHSKCLDGVWFWDL